MQKLIIIPSYLPDNTEIRSQRFIKLLALINQCNQLFNLSIYILIQNYQQNEIDTLQALPNVILSKNYKRLGIAKARERLRKNVLKLKYDYFIFLDDDSILEGDKKSADMYLEDIENNPSGFAQFRTRVMKLFAISKDLFSKVSFEDLSVEDGEAFEDRVFVAKLQKNFPDKQFTFRWHISTLKDTSLGSYDPLSTWYQNRDDFVKILGRTFEIIKNL